MIHPLVQREAWVYGSVIGGRERLLDTGRLREAPRIIGSLGLLFCDTGRSLNIANLGSTHISPNDQLSWTVAIYISVSTTSAGHALASHVVIDKLDPSVNPNTP